MHERVINLLEEKAGHYQVRKERQIAASRMGSNDTSLIVIRPGDTLQISARGHQLIAHNDKTGDNFIISLQEIDTLTADIVLLKGLPQVKSQNPR